MKFKLVLLTTLLCIVTLIGCKKDDDSSDVLGYVPYSVIELEAEGISLFKQELPYSYIGTIPAQGATFILTTVGINSWAWISRVDVDGIGYWDDYYWYVESGEMVFSGVWGDIKGVRVRPESYQATFNIKENPSSDVREFEIILQSGNLFNSMKLTQEGSVKN